MGGCAFPKISRCRKWLPPPDQERAKGIKHAAPCTQGAVIRAELADTQEPVLALGTPASSAMTALPLQKQNQVHGEKKKASSKLRPGPGSQVESQAGKCSLQALGWAVDTLADRGLASEIEPQLRNFSFIVLNMISLDSRVF